MFPPEIAAVLPSLVTEHLQPVGKIAASCKCPSAVALSEAPIDSQEAAPISPNSIQFI